MSYTFSVTRIAHYVKCIMRDNIGSSADAPYIQNALQNWISQYITTVVNPDDLTLRYYPFKAASVEVVPREGMIGWYDCSMSILPHIQFEGMDVELRLDARLG
jgi:type VI secretion system protein ImpC